MKKYIYSLLLITIILVSLSSTTTASAKNTPSLNKTYVELNEMEEYDFNIKNKIKGSTYIWSVGNPAIISVNQKNGIVTGKAAGTSTLTCKITLPNKKTYTLSSVVKVRNTPNIFRQKLMAHAFGGYNGQIYSNTKEAFMLAKENNFKYFEVDLILTSDNKVVALHGWDEQSFYNIGVPFDSNTPMMTYDTFMNDVKIQRQYNTLDLSDVMTIIKNNPSLYFSLDIKETKADRAKIIANEIVSLANYSPSILDRVTIQFISEKAYFAINSVYKFKYYQYFTYKKSIKNIDEVIQFCLDNSISSISINYQNLTKELVHKIRKKGIFVLTFTVDNSYIASQLLNMGVNSVCTNFLTNEDLLSLDQRY